MRAASSFQRAILGDERQQLLERAVAVALGVQRQREVETRLRVFRLGCELGAQAFDVAGLGRLAGELERGPRACHRRALGLRRRH